MIPTRKVDKSVRIVEPTYRRHHVIVLPIFVVYRSFELNDIVVGFFDVFFSDALIHSLNPCQLLSIIKFVVFKADFYITYLYRNVFISLVCRRAELPDERVISVGSVSVAEESEDRFFFRKRYLLPHKRGIPTARDGCRDYHFDGSGRLCRETDDVVPAAARNEEFGACDSVFVIYVGEVLDDVREISSVGSESTIVFVVVEFREVFDSEGIFAGRFEPFLYA